MKRHTNIIITAVASLLIVTLAGREFIKNHKKESNDKSSTNVSENTCEDIPDTSISDTCVADTNTPDTSTSEADILDTTYENNKEQFYISEIPDDIFEKMQGKSYKVDCTLPRENLRYIHVLHVGFDNQVHEGELVVNKDIADDVLRFHIIANSDDKEDQKLKIAVRDAVAKEVANDLRAQNINDKINAQEYVQNNMNKYVNEAYKVIRDNGYSYSVTGTVGRWWFPVKIYGSYIFPEVAAKSKSRFLITEKRRRRSRRASV